jgi:hypothetical protein
VTGPPFLFLVTGTPDIRVTRQIFIGDMMNGYLTWQQSRAVEFHMAEETTELSTMTVVGIGVVLFIVIVGVWYLFLK